MTLGSLCSGGHSGPPQEGCVLHGVTGPTKTNPKTQLRLGHCCTCTALGLFSIDSGCSYYSNSCNAQLKSWVGTTQSLIHYNLHTCSFWAKCYIFQWTLSLFPSLAATRGSCCSNCSLQCWSPWTAGGQPASPHASGSFTSSNESMFNLQTKRVRISLLSSPR